MPRFKYYLCRMPQNEHMAKLYIKLIHPDGAESCLNRVPGLTLGYVWFSKYWGSKMEIVEISEDGNTCWSEPIKK